MPTRELTARGLEEVTRLRDLGLFAESLSALEKLKPEIVGTLNHQTIRAELLERVGRCDEAVAIVRRVLAAKSTSDTERSLCEFILARVHIDSGAFEYSAMLLLCEMTLTVPTTILDGPGGFMKEFITRRVCQSFIRLMNNPQHNMAQKRSQELPQHSIAWSRSLLTGST
jgi:hypothetical protein